MNGTLTPPESLFLSSCGIFVVFGVLSNTVVIFIAGKLKRHSYTSFIVSMAIADMIMLLNDALLQTMYIFTRLLFDPAI